MRRIVFALIIGLSVSGVASAQDAPPPPCGPAGHLPSEISGNVAADSRCFELRIYTAEPARNGKGGIDQRFREGEVALFDLHQRFREGEVALFEGFGNTVQKLSRSGRSSMIPTRWSGCWPIGTARTETRSLLASARTRTGLRSERSTTCRSTSRPS